MSFGIAKVFKKGQSQTIRLPKEFRFDTDEVFISKDGDRVILFPKHKMTREEFFARHEPSLALNLRLTGRTILHRRREICSNVAGLVRAVSRKTLASS